jgi:YqjK-like protein
MRKNLLRLAERRNDLALKAEAQRLQLSQIVEAWRGPLAFVDQGFVAMRFVKKHPVWVVGASVILLKVLKINRIGKWITRGWAVWKIVNKLRSY